MSAHEPFAQDPAKFPNFVLGSASCSRRRVLRALAPGLRFNVLTSAIDERSILATETRELPLEIARAKAAALLPLLRSNQEHSLLLTADQVVLTADGRVRNKPANAVEAAAWMADYADTELQLVSALVVTDVSSGRSAEGIETCSVVFSAGLRAVAEAVTTPGVDCGLGSLPWPSSYARAMAALLDGSSAAAAPLVPVRVAECAGAIALEHPVLAACVVRLTSSPDTALGLPLDTLMRCLSLLGFASALRSSLALPLPALECVDPCSPPSSGGQEPLSWIAAAEIHLPCSQSEFDPCLSFFTALGFRVLLISPADAPTQASLAAYGLRLRLEAQMDVHTSSVRSAPVVLTLLVSDPARAGSVLVAPNGVRIELKFLSPPVVIPSHAESGDLIVSRFCGSDSFHPGRAGLLYRDLLPGRLHGRVVASHIRVPTDGPIPDYVHFHRVAFQVIFVKGLCYDVSTRASVDNLIRTCL
jgi:predicted house-cleaning NTP pyrophosphatase (Maf/HAM1 superfamily)